MARRVATSFDPSASEAYGALREGVHIAPTHTPALASARRTWKRAATTAALL